ncbi:MAG TPA: transglycosylase domain-containing protein, partial [Candidatus Dormibacteraeota bacterium]
MASMSTEGGHPQRRTRSGIARERAPGRRRLWGRPPSRARLGLRIGLGFFAVLCLLLSGLVGYAALTLPDVSAINQATGTIRILDRHGALIGEFGSDNAQRTTVTLAAISPTLRDATIATEDRNFYDEGAFNFGRVAKALFVDVIARRPSQGASTITQQLAKLAFFGSGADRSPLRKLREALLADEIDRMYSKDQILEKYLNLIYYGHGAYGIENASETYFGKHAGELDLREASLLAGLPQAPSAYDPFQYSDAAFARQHVVLASMVADGKITQAQADAVDPTTGDSAAQQSKAQAVRAELGNGHRTATLLAPHFVEYVREQLDAQFKDDPAALAGSVTVTTTLDLGAQRKAETAVSSGVKALSAQLANNGALLMMDSHSGDIIAMVGSANFADDSIDGQYNITTAARRPGSSFKPYVYEEGFRTGTLKPSTILQDTRAESAKLGGVQDFDRQFFGPISAARALLLSRNVPAEQAMVKVGVDNVINFAHSLGISTDLAPNASTAIGTSAVRMIDHTAAYAAFSNGGTVVKPRSILRVVDGGGSVLFDAGTAALGDQVMTPAQADAVTSILRGYPAQWGLRFRHPTAGKSGTTDNFVDAWYMAYSPDWVVATWAGRTEAANPGELPMNGVFGTAVGQQITVPFVNSLTNEVPLRGFSRVSGASGDCTGGGGPQGALGLGQACPTATPSPTASASPAPTPTPHPTPTP